MTIRDRLRAWIFPEMDDLRTLEHRLEAKLTAMREQLLQDLATLEQNHNVRLDNVKRPMVPFRANRKPGRQLRAELEWQTSPEYKQLQANLREQQAAQPQGARNGH